jgi:tetratricopeptide (TPR) repeat protein
MESLEIDSKQLHPRTELSKIYQHQNQWKKAENILFQCLAIEPRDIDARLELGRLYRLRRRYNEAEKYLKEIHLIRQEDIHSRIELALLYAITRQYPKQEEILLNIYDLDPTNIYNLTSLSKVFCRFRKYRIALELLKKALKIDQNDLLSINQIILIYQRFRDISNFQRYYQRGCDLVQIDPNHKHKKQFLRINPTPPDSPFILQELSLSGIYQDHPGGKHIRVDETSYSLMPNAVCNSRVKHGDCVYFALYRQNNHLYVDFIEPYFKDLHDLRALK